MESSFENRILTCANFEERFLFGLLRSVRISNPSHVDLFEFADDEYKQSFNHKIADEISNIFPVTVNHISIPSNNSKEMRDAIRSLVSTLDYRTSNIIFDISVAPIDCILHTVLALDAYMGNFYYVYNEPGFYGESPLLREFMPPEPVIGFAGTRDYEKKLCSLIITGYDVDFTRFVINNSECDKILLGIQSTERFENSSRNRNLHQEILDDNQLITSFSLDSYSDDHGFSELEAQIAKYSSEYNIAITNLGPKPSAISLFRLWKNNPSICLNKSIAKKISKRFSIGIGAQIKRIFGIYNDSSIKYDWIPTEGIECGIIDDCAKLFTGHYGVWGASSHKPFKPITMNPKLLNEYLKGGDNWIATARINGNLIAYGLCKRVDTLLGKISWITQLVVHEDFRNRGIATQILNSVWGFSDHFAWGLATSNPYTVRALEKATRRKVVPSVVSKHIDELKNILNSVFYLKDCSVVLSESQTRIMSDFQADRTELPQRIIDVSKEHPWILGNLEDGDEWLAVVFKEQQQENVDNDYIRSLFLKSDEINIKAYSKMKYDSNHAWLKHTATEVESIMRYMGIRRGDEVLDFGCGTGRHAIALSNEGVNVICVDINATFIEKIKEIATHHSDDDERGNIVAVTGDCRSFTYAKRFEFAICLYDVIGSFPHPLDNSYILNSLSNLLIPGGKLLFSVMNYTISAENAIHKDNIYLNPDALFNLKPSRIMENTGNVFNPDFYLFDENTGIFYRKEQFDSGSELPCELIVRDRRYDGNMIKQLCDANDLHVDWCRPVKLGQWDTSLSESHKEAKELLVLCTRN